MKSIDSNLESDSVGNDLPPAPAKPAVTPWFPLKTPPARVGEYEYRGHGMATSRLIWNGYHFGYYLGSNWIHMADSDGDQWRGLASNPARKS